MKEVLEILEQDARVPADRIADITGHDEAQIRRQIGQRVRSGVTRRYKTVVDCDCCGDQRVIAFIDVSVTPERGAGFDATLDRVRATNTHFLLKRYKDDGDIFAEAEQDHRLAVSP